MKKPVKFVSVDKEIFFRENGYVCVEKVIWLGCFLLVSGNKHVVFDFNAAGIDTSGIKAPFGLTIDNRGLLYTVTQLGAVLVIDPR